MHHRRNIAIYASALIISFGFGWFGRDLMDEVKLWRAYLSVDVAARPEHVALPEEITVSGAGTSAVNGDYTCTSDTVDAEHYVADFDSDYVIERHIGFWLLTDNSTAALHYRASFEEIGPGQPAPSPTRLEWEVDVDGTGPPPTVKDARTGTGSL